MDRLALLKDVQTNRYRKISVQLSNGKNRKVLLDGFTANAALKVHDALSAEYQQKYLALPWPRFIDVTWKLFSSKGA